MRLDLGRERAERFVRAELAFAGVRPSKTILQSLACFETFGTHSAVCRCVDKAIAARRVRWAQTVFFLGVVVHLNVSIIWKRSTAHVRIQ